MGDVRLHVCVHRYHSDRTLGLHPTITKLVDGVESMGEIMTWTYHSLQLQLFIKGTK